MYDYLITEPRRGRRRPLMERFWEKVDQNGPVPDHVPELGPCWDFVPALAGGSYGTFNVAGRSLRAHRFLWEHTYGPVPPGLVLDHICRRVTCVRPSHLRPVTQKQNMANIDYSVRYRTRRVPA